MSVAIILNLLMQIFFVALGVLTVIDFIRYRDGVRRDVALLFCALALPFLVQLIAGLNGQPISEGANSLAIIGLVLEPYLLLRVARHLRSMPGYMLRVAGYALIATILVGIIINQQIPIITLVVSQTYLIGLNLYAMFAFVRGALKATGVTRQRLRCAAVGTGLFALTFLSILLGSALPQFQEWIYLLAEILAIACASAFYIGFIPPRWLRRDWQLMELHAYLLEAAHSARTEDAGVTESLRRLCRSATQAVGGMAAGVIQWNESTQAFELSQAADRESFAHVLTDGARLIEQSTQSSAATAVYLPEIKDLEEQKRLLSLGAGTWLFVPMRVSGQLWGILLVLLRGRSLFIDDDLRVLELFAHENAIILTNDRLITQLRNYSIELERSVSERTAELRESEWRYRLLNVELEQRVQDRTRRLEETNKELESFSYSVSHDLRAPLRAIDGFSRIVVEDFGPQLPPEAQAYLDKVRNNTMRMSQLIDDILKFSQLSRQELKKQPVDLTALVNDVLAELRAETEGRDVEVIIDVFPPVEADRSMLKQVFVNLLSNALKYSRKREHAIIEVRCYQDNGETVYSVKDNGAGFDMQYADKLFGVFQRLHSASEFEGTGVGLAIVQRVISRHGGRIWADAVAGQGATFSFTLGSTDQISVAPVGAPSAQVH